ncbi:uncharacterized protein LOC102711645 isoform X2 [Oryza brachyantha]|uniref:uncharacterized protein LOC102711645 isoform X2 n=1 Tax=Oryza brachyantha TaxID=4533 RepID=UPI00077688A2|nr:uncharacterized protein LOC102711645 isoform X2 [Oryza brachyantha]
MDTSSADIDVAINAAADEQSDDNADPQPPPASTTRSSPKTSIKYKPSTASAIPNVSTPLADPTLQPTATTEEMTAPTTTPVQLADAAPITQDLNDFFCFDVGQYLDPFEVDADTPATLSADIKEQITNILARLDYPINTLINDVGSIRSRIEEIQDQLPDDLIDAIAPVGYIESHRLPVLRACQQIADHASQASAQVKIQADREKVVAEKAKLDELQSAAPGISAIINELKAKKADLEAQLAKVIESLAVEEQRLANLPSAIATQEQTLKSVIQTVIHSCQSLKAISGTDADDLKIIQDADNVRLHATAALKKYLGL